MNPLFTLRSQLAASLLVALLAGWIFQGPLVGGATAGPTATPTASLAAPATHTPVVTIPVTLMPETRTPVLTPRPFVTLPGVWQAVLVLHRDAPPEIESLSTLESGRLTVYSPGDSQVQVLGENDQVLYEQTFQPHFVRGEPQAPVDTIRIYFILPALDGARLLRVTTPQGVSSYGFPTP